jgi:Spy/CpxP family protein refolding chaperone
MNASTLYLRRCAILLAILVLAGGPTLSAQGFKWWQHENFKRQLGLTAEQSSRLEDIFQSSAPNLRNQKKALDRAEAVLEQLVETGDDASVMEQVNVVEAARAELSKSRTVMLLRMRRILTSDQRVKFTALHQAMRRDQKGPPGRSSAGRPH